MKVSLLHCHGSCIIFANHQISISLKFYLNEVKPQLTVAAHGSIRIQLHPLHPLLAPVEPVQREAGGICW